MHRFNATAIPPPYHLCPTSTYWRSIIPFNPNENFVSNVAYKSYSIKNIRRNRRNRNGGTGGTGTRNRLSETRSAEPAEPVEPERVERGTEKFKNVAERWNAERKTKIIGGTRNPFLRSAAFQNHLWSRL